MTDSVKRARRWAVGIFSDFAMSFETPGASSDEPAFSAFSALIKAHLSTIQAVDARNGFPAMFNGQNCRKKMEGRRTPRPEIGVEALVGAGEAGGLLSKQN
jgi:hypothetical protein